MEVRDEQLRTQRSSRSNELRPKPCPKGTQTRPSVQDDWLIVSRLDKNAGRVPAVDVVILTRAGTRTSGAEESDVHQPNLPPGQPVL